MCSVTGLDEVDNEMERTTLLSDVQTEEIMISPVDLMMSDIGGHYNGGWQMTTKPLYCTICGYWASDLADLAKHKDTMKCRRNRLFRIYQVSRVALIKSQTFELLQNDKEKMLKNPHPLGLEVKIAEQEQVLTDITIFN